MLRLTRIAQAKITRIRKLRAQRAARTALQKQRGCWELLNRYLKNASSTGCSFSDYWHLYQTVRALKPKHVLECGAGASTVVLGAALLDNERAGHGRGLLTSMEDQETWYERARSLLPPELNSYVHLEYSPRVEYVWSIFRGVGYREIPHHAYELVFVDGPGTTAPSDGGKTFDFDYLQVVARSESPVLGVIDGRYRTRYVFEQVFGKSKVRYDPIRDLAVVGPCMRSDLRPFGEPSGVIGQDGRGFSPALVVGRE